MAVNILATGMSKLQLDDAALDAMVTDILANEHVNVTFLPDAVERHLYRNVIRLILGLLEESLERIEIKVMGQTLSLAINAEKSDKNNDDGL
jgi:hypothetical protein